MSETELHEGANSAEAMDYEETDGSSDDEQKPISRTVQDEISRFEDSFKELRRKYRVVDRIGEGTFSTVYKAEDLLHDQHRNDWDLQSSSPGPWISPPIKTRDNAAPRRKQKYVALKKIYVTSSPMRILNELELLNDLRSCRAICPLITAFRHQDQVVAVLPYYRHQDFREYFRDMNTTDMRYYLRSLFSGLAAVHDAEIMHRDIKPTNFLYNYRRQHGVLVDFGLAEREGTDSTYCMCLDNGYRREKVQNSYALKGGPLGGYPRHDTRPAKRANRAGTRGFRAPEVLFKCTSQSTKIDVWSTGVILLTMLGRRFPFFNSTDDIDATIEIASAFGKRRMAQCALLHGAAFECTIPSIGEKGFSFEKLILWSTCRTGTGIDLKDEEKKAIRFMELCLELDPQKRISAEEALQHGFLREDRSDALDHEEDRMNMVGC